MELCLHSFAALPGNTVWIPLLALGADETLECCWEPPGLGAQGEVQPLLDKRIGAPHTHTPCMAGSVEGEYLLWGAS